MVWKRLTLGKWVVYDTTDPVPRQEDPLKKRKGMEILNKAKAMFRFESRPKLLEFANIDWLRRYLPNEPILAQRGETGYDPGVEKEVKAALITKPTLGAAEKAKLAKEHSKAVISQMVLPGKESLRSRFKTFITKPYKGLRSQISHQQRSLTHPPPGPPAEELPPPEALTHHGGRKTPARGHDYEGVSLPEDLWDYERAGPQGVKTKVAGRGPAPQFTKAQISRMGSWRRDEPAIHEAMKSAGVIPKNTPLDEAAKSEARRRGQAARDYLAGRLQDLRTNVINPIRAERRAAGATFRPLGEVRNPDVVRVGDIDIHKKVLGGFHKNLNDRIDTRIKNHTIQAQAIHYSIASKVNKGLSQHFHGPALATATKDTLGNLFTQDRTIRPDPQEVGLLTQHTGLSTKQIHNLHRQYRYHAERAYTDLGRQKIHKEVIGSVMRNVPGHHVEDVAHFPALKKLGKRTAIGAGVAAGAGLAGYLIHKRRQKEFQSKLSEIRFAWKPKPWPAARKQTFDMMYRKVGGASTTNTPAQKLAQMRLDAHRKKWDQLQEKFGGTEYGSPLPRVRKLSLWEAAYARGQHQAAGDMWAEVKRARQKAGHAAGFRIAATERAAGKAVGSARAQASMAEAESRRVRKLLPYVGASGVAAGVGTGYYVGQRNGKENRFSMIQFKEKNKDNTIAHDLAVGGIEGAAGYYTTDKLIERIKPKTTVGRLGAAALIGGAATGTIGYGLNRFLRRFKRKEKEKQMAAKVKEIAFWSPPSTEGSNSPYGPKKRLTVAQDRYRKMVREQEINRKESNLAKSAVAGAALAGVLGHKKFGLTKSIIGGGVAGLAAETGLLLRGRRHRDAYGEENISSKRIERIPYQAAGLGLAGIAAKNLYKRYKFKSNGKEIWFQWEPVDTGAGQKPWLHKETERWLKHPKSRVENVERWRKRIGRFREDIGQQRDEHGNIVDERGRTRTPEWKKPWVKAAVGTTAAVGLLVGARKLRQNIGKKAVAAAGLLAHEPPLTPSVGERLALNIHEGGIGAAIKSEVRQRFPHVAEGAQKTSGLISEVRQARDRVLGKVNTAIEKRAGRIEAADVRWNKSKGEYEIQAYNPARSQKALENIHVEKQRQEKKIASLERQRKAVLKSTLARGSLESVVKAPPPKRLSSRLKLIRFQREDDVQVRPYYRNRVEVRPHTRRPRSEQPEYRKKQFRESILTGGLIGSAIGGAGLGWGLRSGREEHKAKFDAYLAKRIVEEKAKMAEGNIVHSTTPRRALKVLKRIKK